MPESTSSSVNPPIPRHPSPPYPVHEVAEANLFRLSCPDDVRQDYHLPDPAEAVKAILRLGGRVIDACEVDCDVVEPSHYEKLYPSTNDPAMVWKEDEIIRHPSRGYYAAQMLSNQAVRDTQFGGREDLPPFVAPSLSGYEVPEEKKLRFGEGELPPHPDHPDADWDLDPHEHFVAYVSLERFGPARVDYDFQSPSSEARILSVSALMAYLYIRQDIFFPTFMFLYEEVTRCFSRRERPFSRFPEGDFEYVFSDPLIRLYLDWIKVTNESTSGFWTASELIFIDALIKYLHVMGQMSYAHLLELLRHSTVGDMPIIARLNKFGVLDERASPRLENLRQFDNDVAALAGRLNLLRHQIESQKLWTNAAEEMTEAENRFREQVETTWRLELPEGMMEELDRRAERRRHEGREMRRPAVLNPVQVGPEQDENEGVDGNVRTSNPSISNI